jgi:DNA polymerase-3 subunit theta
LPGIQYYQGYLPVKQTGDAYVKWNIASFQKTSRTTLPSIRWLLALPAGKDEQTCMPELFEREQPEHLRQYLRERLEVHQQNSQQLPAQMRPNIINRR